MEIFIQNTTTPLPVAVPAETKAAKRRSTRQVTVGGINIGGNAPISVQTMTKTKTGDVAATVAQIVTAAEAGCDIVRVTVNDKEAAEAIAEIVRQSPIPVVADIHFNHIFALKAIEANVAKVRLNPGNIGTRERIHQVLHAAKERGIPIRIGVNSGSLEEDILNKHGYPTAEALFESAMRHVGICDEAGFTDVIVSVKSTDVRLMIDAYRLVAQRTDIPLHLGVTEAGTFMAGTVSWPNGAPYFRGLRSRPTRTRCFNRKIRASPSVISAIPDRMTTDCQTKTWDWLKNWGRKTPV